MAGLLFVFVLLMTAFAVRLAKQEQDARAQQVRTHSDKVELLSSLRDSLVSYNLEVEVDTTQGVLHLGAEILFPSGKDKPTEEGKRNLGLLARVLASVVPDYTQSGGGDNEKKKINALLIEGHTDRVPVAKGSRFRDNWELSSLRSIAVFKELVTAESTLTLLRNVDRQPILGVAGYADSRYMASTDSSESLETTQGRNRRIDLRFVMESPPSEVQQRAAKRLADAHQ